MLGNANDDDDDGDDDDDDDGDDDDANDDDDDPHSLSCGSNLLTLPVFCELFFRRVFNGNRTPFVTCDGWWSNEEVERGEGGSRPHNFDFYINFLLNENF